MNAWSELAAFAGLMALGQFSPGPDMILLTRTALGEGAANGLRMACGIACGLTVHATLAIAGVSLILQRSSILGDALHWIAAAYLLWIASALLRGMMRSLRRCEVDADNVTPAASLRHPFVRGLLCNLLNPKAALFLAAVTAPFLSGDRPDGWSVSIWAVIVFQGFALWSLWVLLLQRDAFQRVYRRGAPWIDGAFGVALAFLALRIAVG